MTTMESAGGAQPRVSLILLAYNQEGMVRQAAESCLAQECEPLEIVLSDDASSDGTYDVLRELAARYRGPHRVSARRNERNAGIGGHYNRLLDATSGDLLVTAAGDDWSVPHRVRRLVQAWEATGCRADLIASHVVDLDHEGRLRDVMRVDDLARYRGVEDWVAHRPYIIGAGHAFTRRMMRRFGPLSAEVFYEDQIMVFRAITGGGAVTVDEPLVHYRRGGTSRKPSFESADHMSAWTWRQRGRERAEMDQLMRDAAIAGCEALVRSAMETPLERDRYLRRLREASTQHERWAAYQEAASLPRWWRLRKLLHHAFPQMTVKVKRMLGLLQRKPH